MSFEEILQKISEYWAVFVASGAYVLFLTYGTVIIKQLFAKVSTSRIVAKFIDKIGGTLTFLKENASMLYAKLQRLFDKVQRLENQVELLKSTLNDMYIKVDAFMEAILTADGQEEVMQSYNNILGNSKPVLRQEIIEAEVFEQLEEPKEEPKKEEKPEQPKVAKEKNKKTTKEVKADVEELY